MTLSEHEQRQLDAIELGLTRDGWSSRVRLAPPTRLLAIAIRLLIGVVAVTIAVVLTFSLAGGLTLLIGCGLLAAIVGLHRYNANNI